MSQAEATRAEASAPQPDLAIRTRPPSPKRLSRKVLLGGAITLGAIVAAALLFGLSAQPPNRARDADAIATAGGPPESIQSAPGQYETADLQGDMSAALLEDEAPAADLAPPSDPAWSGGTPANGPPSAPAGPSPQDLARTAPILFSVPGAAESGERDDQRLPSRLRPPRSRYELMAGAVIPAALATELNSDLPGRVIAQVTAPVFDSVTGEHLLIPQGSRLIGTYDNAVRHGDRRILLVWNRLILPNGWSINLEGMQGGDPAGASGLTDRTDMHLGRLIAAIGMSAIVSVVANNAEEDDEDSSLAQNVGDAAAQEAARTGGRIIDRELSVRPTLRVRAGAPVRVLVMRDIELRPYRDGTNGARR
ncbi:MAG: TrbI/VirB10 family protein [Terricaulis sp.]